MNHIWRKIEDAAPLENTSTKLGFRTAQGLRLLIDNVKCGISH